MCFVKCNDAYLKRSSVTSSLNTTPLTTTGGYSSLDTYIDPSRPHSVHTGFNINNSSSSQCNVVVLDTPHIHLFSKLVPSISSLLIKQTDAMLTRSYLAIMKLCSTSTSTTSSTAKTKATNSSPNPEVLVMPHIFLLDSSHSSRFRCHSSRIYQPKFHSCHRILIFQ